MIASEGFVGRLRFLEFLSAPRFGQDECPALEIVGEFFNGANDEAGRELLRRLPERDSDLLELSVPTVPLYCARQLLDSALPRPFLADERVPQIEEEPASILHRRLISGFDHSEDGRIFELQIQGVPPTARN